MSKILVYNDGLECLQLPDVLDLGTHDLTYTSVFDTATTQNGTYNDEPAYEGDGYWVFKSGQYWCKATTKTNNYWEANAISHTLGCYGSDQDNGTTIAFSISDGTTNYFGSLDAKQSISFCSDEGRCDKAHIPRLSISHGEDSDEPFQFDSLGAMAASFTIFVDGSCKVALPQTQTSFPAEGNRKQVKFEHGIMIGGNTTTVADSITYASNDFDANAVGCIENNCQVLDSIGQANSVCQLKADSINSASGNTVNADEVIYHSDYVRTSVNSGTSFPASPDSGDLFYRTDMRCTYVYDGDTWIIPTEGFPKYSENNWSAFKQAWGRIIPRWKGTLFKTPKLTELSGTWGTYSTADAGVSSGSRWRTGHTLSDGNIIFMPYDENFTLYINTYNDSPAYTINCSGNNKIYSSVYYNDVIYGYSFTIADIVKIDPSNNTIVVCTSNLSGSYTGGVLYNDHIYFVNNTLTDIIKFDPSNNSVTTINYSGNTFSPNDTVNMGLAADNCMYILPYRTEDFIVKFDPDSESFEEIPINLSVNTADKRWDCFVNGPDGIMYIQPTITGAGAQPVFWYNPFTGEWGECSGFTSSTGDAFLQGAAHPSGKIVYASGNDSDTILVLDTETKVSANYDKTASMLEGQKVFQLAGNGNIYGVGRYTTNTVANNTIWKIQLGEPMDLDPHFATSIYMDV